MRYFFILWMLVFSFTVDGQSIEHPANNEAFLQDEVAEIRISINENDLNTLLGDSLYSDHHFSASFLYESANYTKSIVDVGFRVRGNTSRNADKKSFKISFNEFVGGQKFKGLEKMNLIGQHNDPSLLRYWLSLKVLADNGLVSSRASFVKLFINEEYKGLYLNVEHIDDEFVQKRFVDDDEGNLYKCLWGSDMMYRGTSTSEYQWSYELKTNKSAQDYSGLIQFLYQLNYANNNEFPCFIEEHFEVDLFLKTLAVEQIIGHWDGYAFNKNNYYLYQQPSNGKFVFIEYDMDNTFGIDWVGIDWTFRDLNSWYSDERPIIERLLSIPYYRDQFNRYLEEVLTYFEQTDWTTLLQQKQVELDLAVHEDTYYPLDYGFEYTDFLNGLDEAYGGHVAFGITEYIDLRLGFGWNQLNPLISIAAPCLTEEEPEEEEMEPIKEVIKVVDILGRETTIQANRLLIYIYSDGSSSAVIKVD